MSDESSDSDSSSGSDQPSQAQRVDAMRRSALNAQRIRMDNLISVGYLTPPAAAATAPLSTRSPASVAQHRAHPAASRAPAAAAASAVRHPPSASRAPQRTAARAANDALQAAFVRTDCYPPAYIPAAAAVGKAQLYRVNDWEYGLRTNSALLHTSVQLSDMMPDGLAGLGLFATKDFAEGEVIGWLWGKFVTQDDWDAIKFRGQDNTHRAGEEDYVTPVKQGIHRVMNVIMPPNGCDLLLASQQCPMAYINQGHGVGTNNVEIRFPQHPFDAATPRAYQYIPFVVKTAAGRGVSKDEEFTTDYHWNDKTLAELKQLYAKHLAQLSKRPGQMRGVFDCLRAQKSAQQQSAGASSVVSEGASSGSSSSDSNSRRAALESEDRKYNGVDYYCCRDLCSSNVPRQFITGIR